MTIIEFLNARLDEEDRLADDMLDYQKHRSGKADAEPIDVHDPAHGLWVYDDDRMHDTIAMDETRLKREVAAKRAILTNHACGTGLHWQKDRPTCERCLDPDWPEDEASAFPCATVRALATVYADHPDYQEAWKP